ncbi:MAG: FAD/NAD(P)-binding oxidoreductase [Pseudomonadota bacterium]
MSGTIIIGAGQAGSSAAFKLRALGYDADITLIGAEPHPPYQRPPLSKAYLLGEMDRERLFLRPTPAYGENGITLLTGTTVSTIDPVAKTVTTHTEVLSYDDLVLTTGATPRKLPGTVGGDLDGVYTVRTLADIDAMAVEFRKGARALIIGGGYIGLEAAAVAAKRGVTTTLVERDARILGRVAAEETADYFRDLHRAHGVDIREGADLARLVGNTRVTGAEFADRSRLDVDFAIVGIGIVPDTRLAEAAGLTLDNGIACDAMGRTSDPNIWAAGDCASFTYGSGRIRLESVGNAIDMAEAVAANITGADTPNVPKPWFWSDQYDVKLQIAGLNSGYDRVVVRDSGAARSHWYYAGDTLLAIDAMNDPRAYMVGKRLIETGKSADPAAVVDPAIDLKALLK